MFVCSSFFNCYFVS